MPVQITPAAESVRPAAQPQNLIIIMADELRWQTMGCYGDPVVHTPAMDSLAARGTRFTAAYTNSPVCVPARASFATGRYLCDLNAYWDNADPYDGLEESWHHQLRAAGHTVSSIGKLHFRDLTDDYGFTETLIPMHVVEGKGDLMGLVRDDLPKRKGAWKMAGMAGPGESPYTHYDRDITARTETWLAARASEVPGKPWCLFVSLVCPHFPLTAPEEHFARYWNDPKLPMPKRYDPASRPDHPYHTEYAGSFAYDEHFPDAEAVQKAVAGYYGLVSFLDENVGRILAALDRTGLAGNTRVVMTSDHGDNLGARGLWGKSTMYEEAVGIPLIMAGAGVPAGHVCPTPVSLVDLYPTILEGVGLPPDSPSRRPGQSLFSLAPRVDTARTAFSEYHGMGSTAAMFMVRRENWKYVHYVRHPAQLFDLAADPGEEQDRITDPAAAPALALMQAELAAICDPDEVDARCKSRQARLLELNGGRDAVIARGDLGFSPPPGVEVDFNV
ncbi:sulfatase-like hydrolase/transferase [Roseomonas chloroacetimidivorans]|uniref:sulfatase-like hydrolase/transferase n=1 Tax=Roseomonas chloroacetimidivorans TaxID=1766656 RepID=UPI003C7964B9